MSLALLLVVIGAGYLLGSLPFDRFLGRSAGISEGEGPESAACVRAGARASLQTRKGFAFAKVLLDGLKGAAAVLLGYVLAPWGGPIAGLAAWIGHVAPVSPKLHGGGGEATIVGCLFALLWPKSLPLLAAWLSFEALRLFTRLPAHIFNAVWNALGEAFCAVLDVVYRLYCALFRPGSGARFRLPQESGLPAERASWTASGAPFHQSDANRADAQNGRPHEDRNAPS